MNKLLVLTEITTQEEFYIEVPCSNQDILDELGQDLEARYKVCDGDTGKTLSHSVGLTDMFRINDIASQVQFLDDEQMEIIQALVDKNGVNSIDSWQYALYDFRKYDICNSQDDYDIGVFILEKIYCIELHNGPLAHAIAPGLLGKEALAVGIATTIKNGKTLIDSSKIS